MLSGLAYGDQEQKIADVEPINYYLIFDQVVKLLQTNYYDQGLRDLPLKALVAESKNQMDSSLDTETFKWITNDFLSNLKSSYTAFYDQDDQEYWAVKGAVDKKMDRFPVEQVEAWFTKRGKKWFVTNVFDGGVAGQAGLMIGDEVVKAKEENFHPLRSFAKKSGQTVDLFIRRHVDGDLQKISVKVVKKSYPQAFLDGIKKSKKILESGGHKIGYVHLWAATHAEHHQAFRQMVKELAPWVEGLILDFRDGMGGGTPELMDKLFLDRDENGNKQLRVYSKKLTVLINEYTTSGKEWLTAILKNKKRAKVIGQRSAGAMLKPGLFDIEKGQYLLVLPVDKGPEGVQIERNGIVPHLKVAWAKEYSAGHDPQLNFAVSEIAKEEKPKKQQSNKQQQESE